MHQSVRDYAALMLGPAQCRDRQVIEIGSQDVNGSVRPLVSVYAPRSYTGVDVAPGPGVDVVSDVTTPAWADWHGCAGRYGLVICTEVLEHVEDWRALVNVLKDLGKEGSYLFVTTRAPGFPYHAFPIDAWRYTVEDFRAMFADCDIIDVRPDPEYPGVFMLARMTSQPRVSLDAVHPYRMDAPVPFVPTGGRV
jgi:hypothetical protein